MNSKYVDQVYSFSVDIPKNWIIQPIKERLESQNIRLTASSSNEAEIRIYCAPPDPQTPFNKIPRASFYKLELEQNTENKISDALHDIVTPISGKDNSVRVELLTQRGFEGIISVIHAGIEYLIKYKSNNNKRNLIESLINSFCFTGYNPTTELSTNKYDQLIKMLDSENDNIYIQAKEILVQSRSDALSAIIYSINSCNQDIVHALQTRGNAEKEILKLRRRVEILGEIGDARGVSSIIQAIGDSAQSQFYSSESAKLLVVSKEALIKTGNKAVSRIQEILDMAGPVVRKVLIEILIEIGTPNAINVLRPLLIDQDKFIRELVEHMIGVVTFNIEKVEVKL